MRLFVGLPLASEVLKELSEAVVHLKRPQDGLRWTSPQSWHITLQFLGGTDQQKCNCVLARLSEIRAAQFRVRLGDFGLFERAGIFFLNVNSSSSLAALARRVAEATGACGFAAETRPFHPHITLARTRGNGRAGTLKALQERANAGLSSQIRASAEFTAKECLLYESHTLPGGAEYEIRGRFYLEAAAEGRRQ